MTTTTCYAPFVSYYRAVTTWYVATIRKKAVEQLRECSANAVLLDVRMPKHNGFWVYEQIRKEYKDVPIIFNSAYQDAMDGQDAQDSYRPFAYLSKGGDMAQFLQTIAAAVQSFDERKR